MPEVVGDSSTKTPSPPGLPQSGKKNGKKPKPFRFIYMEPVPKSTFRPWNAQAIQVRSHVMKRYHHHRKAKEQSHTEGENAAPVQSAASGSSEEPGFELRSDSHKQFSTNTAAYQDRDVHGRSQEQNENGRMIALFSERGWFSPDPVEILGAGRVDPFRSYPVNDTSSCFPELLDHGKGDFTIGSLKPETPRENCISHIIFSRLRKDLTQPPPLYLFLFCFHFVEINILTFNFTCSDFTTMARSISRKHHTTRMVL